MGLLTWSLTGLFDAGKTAYYGLTDTRRPCDDLSHLDRDMTPSKMIEGFTRLGFVDVTSSLNLEKCDRLPTKISSSGDVYQGVFYDGTTISLKCLRPVFALNETGQKQLEDAVHAVYVWYKCKHPNVLPLIGVAQFRGQLAMISPWMEYQNLEEYLSNHHSSQTDRLELVTQIADGLACLHHTGTVHGDIKGANILVSEDGVLKLIDFGTAGLQEYTLNFSSSRIGSDLSLRWAAPEILSGEGASTYMSDVWALGMLVLETFTNAVPYVELHETVALTKIMNQVLPQRPEKELPTGNEPADLIWELLNQCWAPNPLHRPTASGVRDKMQEIMRRTSWDA